MCNLSDHVTFSETPNTRLSKCKCCGQYALVFNNLYLTFNKEQLGAFANTLKQLKPADFNKIHPSGEQHALLKNCRHHFGVSLSGPEASEIMEVIEEASLFEEVFAILYD